MDSLTEEELVSLERAMKLQPEMARYLIESDWSRRRMVRPYWRLQRRMWQREAKSLCCPGPCFGGPPKGQPKQASKREQSSEEGTRPAPSERAFGVFQTTRHLVSGLTFSTSIQRPSRILVIVILFSDLGLV